MSLQSGSATDQKVEVLSQKFTLGFTYTRSTGPVVGRFLSSLRDGKVVGVKGSDGRVIVPPVEYDPVTAEALTEFVDVADTGEVVNWCWVAEPTEHQFSVSTMGFIQKHASGVGRLDKGVVKGIDRG